MKKCLTVMACWRFSSWRRRLNRRSRPGLRGSDWFPVAHPRRISKPRLSVILGPNRRRFKVWRVLNLTKRTRHLPATDGVFDVTGVQRTFTPFPVFVTGVVYITANLVSFDFTFFHHCFPFARASIFASSLSKPESNRSIIFSRSCLTSARVI